MKLLEELVTKIENRVNWESLKNSTNLNSLLNDYKNKNGHMSREYLNLLRMNIEAEMDMHKTFHPSVILDLKSQAGSKGKTLEDMLKYMESKIGKENTYLSMRSVHTELKQKIVSAGEVPDIFEKALLDSLEIEIFKLGAFVADRDSVWEKFNITEKIFDTNINNLMSEKDPNWSGDKTPSIEDTSSSSSGLLNGVGANTQTKFNWGQGDNKDLLGIRATNNTFSGTDMLATINLPGKGPIVFGELSQLSYSIFREKVPIRTLGRITPKGYTRGLRTITGVMVFSIFDKSIVYECMQELHKEGYRILMDEMPTFDITVTMANEFGHRSTMTLYGVSTYSEGQMMGVDMLGVQSAYEFYAIDIDPMRRMDDDRALQGTSVINSSGDFVQEDERSSIVEYYNEIYSKSSNKNMPTEIKNLFQFERN